MMKIFKSINRLAGKATGGEKMKTVAETLAEFTEELCWEDIPLEVRENVKLRILDTIGLCLASYPMSFQEAVLGMAKAMGGPGVCTVVGKGSKLTPSFAALVNGTASHALDFDDTHPRAVVHASACIIPTALAMAEANHRSGRDLITAAIAGYETMIRLGAAAAGKFHARGFHATSVAGTFAAGLVAGKLLGLDRLQAVNTLGIAGSQAAGILEFLEDGSWVKQLHPGWAAHSGIIAAELAKRGMKGPKTVLEGRFGLYKTHVGNEDWDAGSLTDGLGTKWETLDICFKPYPACHFIHACLDCVAIIRRDHYINLAEVDQVTCSVPEGIVPFVCEPVEAKLVPRTGYEGKFSLQFSVAAMLVEGKVNLSTYLPEKIQNQRILEMARRVRYEIAHNANFPKYFPGGIVLKTRDGRCLEHHIEINRGGPGNPMEPDEIKEKFRDNAILTCNPDRIKAIVEAIEELDYMNDAGKLLNALNLG